MNVDNDTTRALTLVCLVLLSVGVGTVSFSDPSEAAVLGLSIAEDEIRPGDPFTYGFYDDAPDDGDTVFVVIDEDNDDVFDSGENYTSVSSSDDSTISDQTFPGANTGGLDGTYDVWALENDTLSPGDDLTTGDSNQISIDASAPTVSDVALTNPAGQDLELSVTTDENFSALSVSLTGPETTTLTLDDFTNESVGGDYVYNATYDGDSEGTYTAEVTRAEDAVGNDAAAEQSAGSLTDTATVDTIAPTIDRVEAAVGSDTATVYFSEGVRDGSDSALTKDDFAFADANGGGATAVSSVSHAADADTATLTLDAAVTRTDLGNDTVAAASGRIYDDYDNAAGTATTALADTTQPAAPVGAAAPVVNASNAGDYDFTVSLPDDHGAGTLEATVSDGSAAATASAYVAAEDDANAATHEVAFTGVDVSALADGQVSVSATFTDDGGNAVTAADLVAREKDTAAPTVEDASITNASIDTYDAGTEQTVTVQFDEDVNQSVAPSVTITGLATTYSVSGSYDSATQWTGTVTIDDENEDATATIEVEGATDLVGNRMALDASNTFRVNTTGPARPESTAAADINATNQGDYAVTVNLVTGSAADEVRVQVSDGATAVTASKSISPGTETVTVTGLDVSGLADGEDGVTVSAMALDDGYANSEGFSAPTTVTKDTDAPGATPAIQNGQVADADAGTARTVTVQFDEPMNQSVAPTVTVSGLTQSYTVSGSYDDATTWTGSVTIADDDEDATATIEVSGAEDALGNALGTQTATFPVDTVVPVISNVAASNPSGQTVAVSFDASEQLAATEATLDTPGGGSTTLTGFSETANGDGSYTYTASYDGSGDGDGSYDATLTAAADDLDNDGASGQQASVTVDTTAPTFGNESPAGTVTDDRAEIRVDVTDATTSVDPASIRVTVTDADGTVISNAGTGTAGVSFAGGTLTVDPATAGVAFADGDVTVSVDATDTASNDGSTAFSFTVDTTAPAFADAAPNATTVGDDQTTIRVDVADATSAVDADSLTVTLEDSGGTVFSGGTATAGVSFSGGTLTVDPADSGVPDLPNEKVTVTVDAADTEGNSASKAFSFTVDSPPQVGDFAVSNPSGQTVAVSFDASEQLAATEATLDTPGGGSTTLTGFSETANGDGSYTYTASYDGSGDGDGSYDATLTTASDGVTDAASGQQASVTVDTTAPTLAVAAPSSATVADDQTEIRVDVTDATTSVDPASIRATVADADGTVLSDAGTGASGVSLAGGTLTVDPAAAGETFAEGNVSVTVEASDTRGNAGDIDFEFALDSTPPTISNFSLSNPTDRRIQVSLDSTESLATVGVTISGAEAATLTTNEPTTTDGSYVLTYAGRTNGTYNVTLDTATDAADNDGAAVGDYTANITVNASTGGGTGGSGGNGGGGSGGNGGGGSGGGNDGGNGRSGGSSDQPLAVALSPGANATNVSVSNAEADENAPIEFEANATADGLNLTRLDITATRDIDYSLSVGVGDDQPNQTTAFDGRTVGFAEVNHTIADDDIDAVTFTFRVNASRFDRRGLAPERAVVYRHHDGAWNALETTVVDRDNDTYVLRATSPGLSAFALGVRDADLLSVTGASLSRPAAAPGDTFTVSATVANSGAWTATDTLEVTANGTTVATQSVAVPAGETATVAIDAALDRTGEYRLAVDGVTAGTLDSDPDAATRTTTTTETTTQTPTRTSEGTPTTARSTDAPTEPTTASGDVPGFGIPAALAALLGIVASGVRRSRRE